MDTSTWRCSERFGDCPRRAYLQTNACSVSWSHLDILKVKNTPGLWYHESCPITFILVVDNFGVKYENKDDVDHLIASIKKDYMLTEDWTGNLYCEIQLNWDYAGRTVNISMPGYIKKEIAGVRAHNTEKNSGMPILTRAKKNGTEAQASFPQDNMPKLDEKGIKRVQKIVRSILYYVRAVNVTV
jgi:hypothetical protein